MTTKTVELLDHLAHLNDQMNTIQRSRQDKLDTIEIPGIPPEIQTRINGVNNEFDILSDVIAKEIAKASEEIKANTIEHGESIVGQSIRCSFVKGRVSWDSAGLEGAMAFVPQIEKFRKVGSPSARISAVKKKK